MAFKITQKPTFTTRVKVDTPNDKGGFDKSDFMATFQRVNMDEIGELRKLTQKEVQEKVLIGWSDLLDDDNRPVDFNEANVWALLNIPQALFALNEAFWTSLIRAREKN